MTAHPPLTSRRRPLRSQWIAHCIVHGAAALALSLPGAALADAPPPHPGLVYAGAADGHLPGIDYGGAEDRPPAPKGEKWDASFWGRARFNGMPAFPLDTRRTANDQTAYFETRLRAAGAWTPNKEFAIRLEVDALSGIAGGDLTTLGTARGTDTLRYRLDKKLGITPIDIRQLYFSLDTPVGEVRFGRQAFTWGLGVLANAGAGEPDFGDRRFGDVSYRLSLAARPLARLRSAPAWVRALGLFAAADFGYKDAFADNPLGDTVFQGVFGLRTATPRFTAGILEVFRFQRDREDAKHPELGHPRLTASATDAFASLLLARTRAGAFRLEAEGAVLLGNTTRTYLEEARNGASLRAFGGVARLRFDDAGGRLTIKSEMGYASGDADPHDDALGAFSFNPDYKVGLLLFDQVLPRLAARAIDRLSDPAFAAVPPPGLRYAATQGSVTNAVYWNPVVRVRPFENADLRVGYLLAWTTADLVDPYNATLKGGYNTTYGGKTPGSHALGQEVDLGLRYTVPIYWGIAVRGGAEGALFIPGAAFDGVGGAAGMGLVWMGRGMVDLTW